jgi:hypothetical protein
MKASFLFKKSFAFSIAVLLHIALPASSSRVTGKADAKCSKAGATLLLRARNTNALKGRMKLIENKKLLCRTLIYDVNI